MPLTTLLPVIIVSIIFGVFVATYMAKSDKTDKAALYQKGLSEGEAERSAMKEKMQANLQKLADLGKERDLERQVALNLRAEVEALRNAEPSVGGMDEATLQALKTAFEEKTAELLQAEQTANEGFRIRASDQIARLEASLATTEAARVQALEDASAQASAHATLAELSEPQGISEDEMSARIATAVDQVRTSEAQAIAAKQLELAATAQELATAQLELNTVREQLESASGQVKQGEQTQASSDDAIAAVNAELLRLNDALQAAQNELADRTAQADAESTKNMELQSRLADLETQLAQAEANRNSLQADGQLSRDEIGEWRRLFEEAEAKNQELEATSARQLQDSAQSAIQAVQETRQYAAFELADALAARDRAHEEALQQALQTAAAQAAALQVPAAESEELTAMRELVSRMEGRLGDIAQSQNGQLEELTKELNGMRQVAALSRAVCDGALRQTAHAENLRVQFESAARAFLDGHTAFASEILAPVKQLQTMLENTPVAAGGAPVLSEGIEALQQAVEAPAPAEVLAEA